MRLPVFLGRRPAEPVDRDLVVFYERLLNERSIVMSSGTVNGGRCERSDWPDNQSLQNILAWWWKKDDARWLVVINFRRRQPPRNLSMCRGMN